MSLPSAFSIVILLTNLSLGFFVYLQDRKKKLNQLFLLLVSAISIWIIGIILIPLTTSLGKTLAIFVGRLPFFGASILAGVFLYFVQLFPKEVRKIPKIFNVFFFLDVLFLGGISFFSNLILKDMTLIRGGYQAQFGPLYSLWMGNFLILIFIALGIAGWKYKFLIKIEKIQVKYFFTGVILSAFSAIITNLAIPLIIGSSLSWQYGPLTLIFLVIFATYAISKHHLFDIKIIATELLVGLISFILFIDILLSKGISRISLKSTIFLGFLYLGWSLIRSVSKEIKRRKQLEELTTQLRAANRKLQELDKAKSEFLSIASHQLRTPLTITKGYASMILEGGYGPIPPAIKKPLANIYHTNEKLIKLVRDLLNLSRIEAGRIKLHLESTALDKLIKKVIEELKIEATKKDLYLKFQKPTTPPPPILLDREKISQVILNIVDNAIKYTNKGGITIQLQVLDSKLKIIIHDTGAGMTKDEIQNIFKSFSRGEAGTKLWAQGAGLGLYIAKKFINLHHGKIWVESPGKNKGSTFYIELPIRDRN